MGKRNKIVEHNIYVELEMRFILHVKTKSLLRKPANLFSTKYCFIKSTHRMNFIQQNNHIPIYTLYLFDFFYMCHGISIYCLMNIYLDVLYICQCKSYRQIIFYTYVCVYLLVCGK